MVYSAPPPVTDSSSTTLLPTASCLLQPVSAWSVTFAPLSVAHFVLPATEICTAAPGVAVSAVTSSFGPVISNSIVLALPLWPFRARNATKPVQSTHCLETRKEGGREGGREGGSERLTIGAEQSHAEGGVTVQRIGIRWRIVRTVTAKVEYPCFVRQFHLKAHKSRRFRRCSPLVRTQNRRIYRVRACKTDVTAHAAAGATHSQKIALHEHAVHHAFSLPIEVFALNATCSETIMRSSIGMQNSS